MVGRFLGTPQRRPSCISSFIEKGFESPCEDGTKAAFKAQTGSGSTERKVSVLLGCSSAQLTSGETLKDVSPGEQGLSDRVDELLHDGKWIATRTWTTN